MLKKLVHISFVFLLLTMTAGFTISKHYCGPRLVSVSINHEAKSCCNMEGTSNCCHNETKIFQLDENFIASPLVQINIIKSIDLFIFSYTLVDINFDSEEYNDLFISESPPPKDRQTILSNLQTYIC